MGKAAEITVDVKAKLSVDRKTAETCLRLLEIYVNENNVEIIGHRKEDGTNKFEFVSQKRLSKNTMEALNAIGLESHREDTE